MRSLITTVALLCAVMLTPHVCAAETGYDIVVYGGTSGGVAAAVQAARDGRSLILLEPCKHLGGLPAGGLGATDIGLVHLAELTQLSELEFGKKEKLKGSGLKHLKGLTKLQSLNLFATGVDDAGLEGLKELTQVKYLTLPARITDAGLVYVKGLTQLTSLTVSSPGVTDAGVEHLKGLTKLESLQLSQSKLTDKGLAELKGLTLLTFLDVSETKVTDEGIKTLKKSLPKLEVSKSQ